MRIPSIFCSSSEKLSLELSSPTEGDLFIGEQLLTPELLLSMVHLYCVAALCVPITKYSHTFPHVYGFGSRDFDENFWSAISDPLLQILFLTVPNLVNGSLEFFRIKMSYLLRRGDRLLNNICILKLNKSQGLG